MNPFGINRLALRDSENGARVGRPREEGSYKHRRSCDSGDDLQATVGVRAVFDVDAEATFEYLSNSCAPGAVAGDSYIHLSPQSFELLI